MRDRSAPTRRCSYSWVVRVFLVRHAEAEPGEPDDLRTLTSYGRSQARELGTRFVRRGIRPDAVLSSPLLRARETAEGIAAAVGLDPVPDERLAPGATVEDVRAVVAGRGEIVVVVGHQPDCGLIAAAIEGGDAPAFPAGGIRELQL
jgi:phosphohistidine phosphatase